MNDCVTTHRSGLPPDEQTKPTHILSTAWYNAYDFSHDVNGNPTAQYELWVDGKPVIRTKRRRQIGYSNYTHSNAEYEMKKHYYKVFKQRVVYRIEDPMHHAWAFDDENVKRDRFNRSTSNVVYYLVLDIPAHEWARTPEGVHRRLQGLLMPYIEQRVKGIINRARGTIDSANTSGIEHLTGRFDSDKSTVSGLYLSDAILETALMKSLKDTAK